MELTNYAKIGRAQLLSLLGLQENHKKEIEVLDPVATGCNTCPFHAVNQYLETGAIESKCDKCPHAVFKTKTVYVNEHNQYGRTLEQDNAYIPDTTLRLKSGAILLYITLHFYKINTATGAVYDVNTKELAEFLSCDKKTIYNNLNILQKYGYIRYIPVNKDYITVVIQQYKKIFMTASNGGRGYFLITEELLNKLAPVKKINDLRLYLRFLDSTLQEERSGHRNPRVRMSYDDIRHWMPVYVKPYIIRNSLKSLTPVFDIFYGDSDVAVSLNPEYHSAKQIAAASREHYINITEYIKSFQDIINDFNTTKNINDPRLEEYNIHLPSYRVTDDLKIEYNSFNNFYMNHDQRQQLAALAVEYSGQEVLHALQIYFNEYIQPGSIVRKEPGALIRTIIRDERTFYKDLCPLSQTA